MKDRIIESIYDAVEHAVNAGDFEVECMCIDNGKIYMTINNKDYVLTINEYKL